MRRRILALGTALLLSVVPACSGGGKKSTRPPAAPGPNPDVVPAVITPAYVDAVFKVLNHINGDAVRSVVASRRISPGVTRELQAIYQDPLFSVEVKVFQQGLESGLSNVKATPGDRVTTVNRLISWTGGCIFVATSSDLSAVEVKPGPPAASEYWQLSLKTDAQDPNHLNPTPWALSDNEDFAVPTTVTSPC